MPLRSKLRGTAASAWQPWYKTKAWLSIRARRLRAEPLCQLCDARGIVTPATVCDHIKAHKGDRTLFFDFDNTQSLCKRCHDTVKQAEEARGYIIGHSVDGRPLDPQHPWNAKR